MLLIDLPAQCGFLVAAAILLERQIVMATDWCLEP